MSEKISIIVPVTNQAAQLDPALQALQPLREAGHELLVVDGGSRDASMSVARRHADRVLMSGSGRALQFNAGGEYASHEVLLFLPVEASLPAGALDAVVAALAAGPAQWGHFRASGPSALLGLAANWRSRFTRLACAEQAIFVRRTLFEMVKGFDHFPGLEDLAFSRKLLRHAQPVQLATAVRRRTVSELPADVLALRRWLRLAYLFGADAERLADRYMQQLERR